MIPKKYLFYFSFVLLIFISGCFHTCSLNPTPKPIVLNVSNASSVSSGNQTASQPINQTVNQTPVVAIITPYTSAAYSSGCVVQCSAWSACPAASGSPIQTRTCKTIPPGCAKPLEVYNWTAERGLTSCPNANNQQHFGYLAQGVNFSQINVSQQQSCYYFMNSPPYSDPAARDECVNTSHVRETFVLNNACAFTEINCGFNVKDQRVCNNVTGACEELSCKEDWTCDKWDTRCTSYNNQQVVARSCRDNNWQCKVANPTAYFKPQTVQACDTNPPNISSVSVSPDPYVGGLNGTKFVVRATVRDTTDLTVKVRWELKYPGVLQYAIPSLELFDDGNHSDGLANDAVFANIWDSALEAKAGAQFYKIQSINATDSLGNSAAFTAPDFGFAVKNAQTQLCKEFIPGNNNAQDRRINLVFVGIGYNQMNDFIQIVNESVDWSGGGVGIFSREPFKSNKNAFNVWYVDALSTPWNVQCGSGSSYARNAQQCEGERNKLAGACVFPNRYVFGMYNQASPTLTFYALLGGDSVNLFPASLFGTYSVNKTKLVVHELGHMFGYLGDEYQASSSLRPSSVSASERNIKNCVHADYAQCIDPATNYWQRLVGDGCGAPGVVDCSPSNPLSALEVKGCVLQECEYPNSWRPNENTIMRHQYQDPYSYGPVNEKLLCEKIVEKTKKQVRGVC